MEPSDKKVLVLYNKLFHYRIPIFELVAEKCDLTVAYCYGPDDDNNRNFKKVRLTPYKIGPFTFQKENIFQLCQQYDVVIAYGEIAWLKYTALSLRKHRNFKIAYWGIGVSASYNKHYDSKSKIDFIKKIFYKLGDAKVFYTDYPIQRYIKYGFRREQLFVANNTVQVKKIKPNSERNKLLFIGSLYREKGLDILLESYKKAYDLDKDIYDLQIIGGGDYDWIEEWIHKNEMVEKVKLLGPIYDIDKKAKYFNEAIAAICPNQAGLSVLESMGYAVPYITSKNAITGGEIFNIEHGKTGVTMDDYSNLVDIILDIKQNPLRYLEMGNLAYEHYWSCRKASDMANSLLQAIQYLNK